ncbi:uncharacterized protein LOC126299376 isoform X2 [Schistocerca gregaria]|uniref:uncharacterized protein LOC126299376 isoform X2 n=1 Tax=Schistocerca gregaria TaxID=7010 RepID=UPI00211E9BB1|nr:uncharacterized protein LOC126299376 isoform X2 [Schistocerca gregaria]
MSVFCPYCYSVLRSFPCSTPMIQPIAKRAEVVSGPSLATLYVLKHSPSNNSTSTIQPIPKQAAVVPHSSIGTVRVLLHNKWCCSPTFKPVPGQDKMASVPSLTTVHVLQHGYGMQPVMPGNSQINYIMCQMLSTIVFGSSIVLCANGFGSLDE